MTGKHANRCVVAHDVVVQKHRHRVQSDQNIAQCRPDLGSRLVEVVPRGFQVHIRHDPMHARRGREGQAAAALTCSAWASNAAHGRTLLIQKAFLRFRVNRIVAIEQRRCASNASQALRNYTANLHRLAV